jgi:hypothetical protein
MTEIEAKAKLYALRKTDYGFHGKTTERAITGGYTRPAREEGYEAANPKHTALKPGNMSARPHGGAPGVNPKIYTAKAVDKVERNNLAWLAARHNCNNARARRNLRRAGQHA